MRRAPWTALVHRPYDLRKDIHGARQKIKKAFGNDIKSIDNCDVPADIRKPGNLHIKRFIEEALCLALSRNKPLLYRIRKSFAYLIVDPHTNDEDKFDPLFQVVGKTSGIIPGLSAANGPEDRNPKQVTWSEALRLSVDYKNGQLWLLIDPDIWIWPPRARQNARELLDQRRSDRFNMKYNLLLDAWIKIILCIEARNVEISVSAFSKGNEAENPTFRISTRTAFSRRLTV